MLAYGPNVKGNLAMMVNGIKHGWFPSLPETGNKRSLVHVDDLVRAIHYVNEATNLNKEIFIVSDGNYYSSSQIYTILNTVLKSSKFGWRIPLFALNLLSKINSNYQYKINKLMGDEPYSSCKIQKIGFKAKFSLKNINEKIF